MRASIISKLGLSNFIQLKLPMIRPAVSGSDFAYDANDSKAITTKCVIPPKRPKILTTAQFKLMPHH